MAPTDLCRYIVYSLSTKVVLLDMRVSRRSQSNIGCHCDELMTLVTFICVVSRVWRSRSLCVAQTDILPARFPLTSYLLRPVVRLLNN